MSDNLLLTLLGAVGIGALVMGMNSENVKENWVGMEGMRVNRVKMYIDPKSGAECPVEVDDSNVEKAVLNIGKAVKKEERRQQDIQMMRQQQQTKENYEDENEFKLKHGLEYWPSHDPQLGSGMVADDFFHRVPGFQQTIPQPSPDMQNLGVPGRMHQAGMQGYTESFNQPMQYASLIENYEDAKASQPQPQQVMGSSNPENVVVFERLMASTKGGGRFNSKGSVDYIRGDIPVCPDPCQNGWFKSSAKPQDVLQVGAVANMIAGDNTAKDLQMLLASNGRMLTQQYVNTDMNSQTTNGNLGMKQQLP